MRTVTTSAKGQVVIPKKEREKIGLKAGMRVVVEAFEDRIEIRLLPKEPVEYFCGIFRDGPSLTKALLKHRKEEATRERKKSS